MCKHAICIMAHKNVEQINTLLSLLDHPLIDIFLHLDFKSSIMQSDIISPSHSHLYFVNRHDVRWGDISLVESELDLFKAVLDSKNDYDRIHLISAQDLPMKSASYILEYFAKSENKNVEFLDCSEYPDAIKRLQYYWFCTKQMRYGVVYKIIRHSLLLLQKIIHVNRLRNTPLVFKYGSEWASLTHKAVQYLVSEYPKYRGVFKYTVCADELYKQMLLWDGKFRFSKKGNLRYAKFNGSSPELVPMEKLEELFLNPDILYARKFDKCQLKVINAVISHFKLMK